MADLAAPLSRAETRGRLTLLAVTLGSGMAILDGSIVNIALKTIGEDLDASLAELQWVTNGYLLALDEINQAGGVLGKPLEVEFADDANSTYYISGNTGAVLERRNDSWRLWDFFWMLHTMDYSNRASFNHPLIVTVAIGAVWLALTGLYLVFKTNWRSEARWLRRNQPAHEESRRS